MILTGDKVSGRYFIVSASLLLFSVFAEAQSAYLPLDHKHAQFLNRLEILMKDNVYLNVSTPKPFIRKEAVTAAVEADSAASLFH